MFVVHWPSIYEQSAFNVSLFLQHHPTNAVLTSFSLTSSPMTPLVFHNGKTSDGITDIMPSTWTCISEILSTVQPKSMCWYVHIPPLITTTGVVLNNIKTIKFHNADNNSNWANQLKSSKFLDAYDWLN